MWGLRKQWQRKWVVALCAIAFASHSSAQVLSRLGSISSEPPGSQAILEGNWVYSLTPQKLLLVLEVGSSLTKRAVLPLPSGREQASAIAKSGNFVYIANDPMVSGAPYLTVVDVSNPASPTVVADIAMPSSTPTITRIVVNGNYLYMFPYSGDMRIVSVANPSAPVFVRSVSMSASDGVVVGNRLYTAEGTSGLGIWDISQPDNPARVGSLSLSGTIMRVQVSGNTLYALSDVYNAQRVHLVDITNRDAPSLISTFNTTYTARMAHFGNYLYLSNSAGKTQIVDVSNPAAPTEVAVVPIGRVNAVDAANARLLGSGDSWYRIFSLSNPTNPTPGVEYAVPAPREALRSGAKVYAAEEKGLVVYDVSVPATPTREQVVDIGSSGSSIAQVDNDLFAIAQSGNLKLVQMSGSSGTVVWSNNPTPPNNPVYEDRVRVAGNVLAFSSAPMTSGVRIVDISDPASPQVASDIPFISRFDIRAGYLYAVLGGSTDNFRIYSLSDPYNPSQVASLNIPFSATNVAAGSGYALVAGFSGELALVNVSNPASPQIVAQRVMSGVSLPRVAYSEEGYFFVYDPWNRRLEIYRVSDFPNFTPYRTQTLDARLRHLHFTNDLVIGSAGTDGLIVYQNLIGTGGMLISAVTPNRAGNAGTLTIVIDGVGFPSGATVRLERGAATITPTSVHVRSASRIEATFDFTGQPINTQWDVVVRSPDNAEVRLANGFTIVEPVPVVSSITPNTVYPQSSVSLTINGELFTPGAQVEVRPSGSASFTPIAATSVQFVSQRQLQATFDLSSLQALNLSAPISVSVVVTNSNNRSSNAGTLTVRGPSLDLQVAQRIYALRDEPSVAIEVTVNGAVGGEPLQFELSTGFGNARRTLTPAQVESLGSNRWRLTFNRADILPDGFFEQWTPSVRQLGASDYGSTLSFHQYRGVRKETSGNQFSNLSRTLTLRVLAFDADNNTTFVLRKGDVVREPTQVERYTNYYEGGIVLQGTFPVQITDLGAWDIEVRYSDEAKTLANAFEIVRGTPTISRVTPNFSPFQYDQIVEVEGSGFHDGMQGVLVIQDPDAAIDSRELTPVQVLVNEEGTRLTLVFHDLYNQVRENTYVNLVLRSPYVNLVQYSLWTPITPPSLKIVDFWGPSFFRAGRWERFTVAVSTGAYPEVPTLSVRVPFTETDLNSGAYDFEYRVIDAQTGQVLQSGRRPLNPESVLITVPLSLIPANTTRYYTVEVRAFGSGRAASPQIGRGRFVPLAYFAASGLFIAGSMVLKVSCEIFQEYGLKTAIATALAEMDWDIPNSTRDRLLEWMLDDPRNLREIMRCFTSFSDRSVFDYLRDALTSEVISMGQSKIKEALADKADLFLYINSRYRHLPEQTREQVAQSIADAFYNMWEAYQGLRQGDVGSILKSNTEKILGELLKAATDQVAGSPLEPELDIPVDLSGIPAEALGAFLNATANTFISIGTDCIKRSRQLEQYFSRITNIQPMPVRTSWDPNEKRGSSGVAGYIAPDQSIVYELLFENLPTATAGAEEVLVEDTLPEALDPSTLEFFEIQVGNKRVSLPEGTTSLNTQIDLRPERPVVVRVVSQYDSNTRKLSVRFSGIDPNTNDYYPEGFLPPNTNPPQGEGAVRFRIRPRSDAASGTQIANQAVITFDPHLGANPPIVTNTHTLTLDKQPPSITVEAPSSTTLTETKATLRWNATDDASGVQEVEVWALEGNNARRLGYTEGTGARQESGTVNIRARRFGDETRIITRGRDRVGNLLPFSDTPQLTLRFGQPPQFRAGLHLVGIPVQLDNPDVKALFGFQNNQWATYDPATGQYVQHPQAATAPQIGRGYWTLLPNAVAPNVVGNLPDPEQPYVISLQAGWNLIANPWTEPLVWNRAAITVRTSNGEFTLDQNSARQIVEPYLWGWQPEQGRYQLVYDAQLLNGIEHQLQPWRGYWIYAHQPCELVLPTPETAAQGTRNRAEPAQGGWSLRIGAHLGNQYDEVLVGLSSSEQGLQVAMPPAPPGRSASDGLHLRLVRDGKPMEAETLPRSRNQRQWTLELVVPPSEEPRTRTLTLTAPDIARLPRGVNPVLRDLETGERRFLRGAAAWQITVPPEGITRRYELSLVATSRLLRITNLQVQGGRNTGGTYTVQFNLSEAAKVTVSVQSGGRVIRTLEQSRSRNAGIQQVVWDGRDQQGRALPPGAYTLVITAETTEGQVARATTPVMLTR